MTIHVRIDDPRTPEVAALIAEHLAAMRGNTPLEHVHALAVAALGAPDITFFTAWHDGLLCGCGALRDLGDATGEVKSMRTRTAFLRRGVGRAVLSAIEHTARQRGLRALCLETGTGGPFAAAHAFYLQHGFAWCGAFGSYSASPFNVFMRKDLVDGAAPTANG